MKQYERKPSYIGGFIHEGKCYEHYIFCHEDDRIECRDMEDKSVVLTYTANCQVLGNEGVLIGTWSTLSTDFGRWYFESDAGIKYQFGSDLLRAEVELSQMYSRGDVV